MTPALVDGDLVLAKSVTVDPALEGKLVIATHPHTGIEIVKRVQSVGARGVWLLSDNPDEGSDSRRFGPVAPDCVTGTVTFVLNRPFNSTDRTG